MARLLREAEVAPAERPDAEGVPRPAPAVAAAPKRRRGWWAVAAVAVALGVGGWAWQRSATPAAPALVTAPVAIGTVEESVLATGLLKPTELVAVGAQVSGRITDLAVTLGQEVKAGDLIAEIDPVPRQNALRIAEAGLAEVKAERAEQQAMLAEQQRVLKRQQSLVARSAVAQSEADTAASDVAVTEARIEALAARIQSAEVAIDDARVDLGYTRITAPRDGTVLAVVAQQGQTVNATQTTPTIVVLGNLATMSIEAGISEADVVRVGPGQEVWFAIVGDPGTRHKAMLASIAPAPASITKDTLLTGEESGATTTTSNEAIYYNGLFAVPNPDGQLRTYMTAEVHVVLGRAEEVPTIPASALGARHPDGTRSVRVQLASGGTEERRVVVGLDDQTTAQIVSGLALGEQVVVGEADGTSARALAAAQRRGPPPMGF
ncbi:MAG: efflux RND transporter periplasmic adaptor subunit [Amaricoccus sp.]